MYESAPKINPLLTIGGGLAASRISGNAVFKANTNNKYDADEQRWSASMARAQTGDQTTYQQLLTELSNVIQRYLVSRFGQQNFIEDCVQEALLAIHNARHTYQPDRPFRPWMFAIVRNKSIDMLRKNRSYDNALDSKAQADALDAEPSYNQALETAITQGRLINALAPPFKQAIVLTKLIGFTNAEAAAKLSISEMAVKVRVHRGIAKLKSLLEADDL